jgi:hypothetical protein
MVSTPVSIAAQLADAGLAALLLAGLAFVARAERRMSILWIGGAAVLGWLGLTFALAKSGLFETTAQTSLPPRIGPAIVIPTILGCALLALASVRRLIARVPLHWLVGVQLYRIVGGLFLIAWLQDDVPAEFALPAGIGDITVGLLAPFVALMVVRGGVERAWPAVVGWCALGITDLAVAVTCGILTAPSAFQQLALDEPNAAITSYPLVLIPAFGVPVSIVLHVYAVARLSMRAQEVPRARLA